MVSRSPNGVGAQPLLPIDLLRRLLGPTSSCSSFPQRSRIGSQSSCNSFGKRPGWPCSTFGARLSRGRATTDWKPRLIAYCPNRESIQPSSTIRRKNKSRADPYRPETFGVCCTSQNLSATDQRTVQQLTRNLIQCESTRMQVKFGNSSSIRSIIGSTSCADAAPTGERNLRFAADRTPTASLPWQAQTRFVPDRSGRA